MLTKEQLKERKTGIGGSDVAAILGISPFKNKTALSVYLDKLSEGDIEDNMNLTTAMEFGNILEPLLGEVYAKKTGDEAVAAPPIIYKNPKAKFMLASPDFFVLSGEQEKLLECKTVGIQSARDWNNGIPIYYLTQVAHYAIVFDMPVDVIALINNEFKIFTYERNDELESLLIQKEKYFWEENVLKHIPPTASNAEDVLRLYPRATLKTPIIATDKIEKKIYALREIKDKIKALEQLAETQEMEIKNHIGNAESLVDISGKELATWKNIDKTTFDSKSFQSSNPELFAKYKATKSYRAFLLKLKAEKTT